MPRVLLAVYHAYLLFSQQLHERREGNLRSVRFTAEHRLTEKKMPEGDTVQTPNQSMFAPDFDRMRESAPMQLHVGRDHVSADPCALLAGAGLCAGAHDALERAVNSNRDSGIMRSAAQFFA